MFGMMVDIFLAHQIEISVIFTHVLSHIPVAKTKATRQLHARGMSICDVILMLKLRHHVTSQLIQVALEVFFMFFQYKMRYLVVSKKKNPLIV